MAQPPPQHEPSSLDDQPGAPPARRPVVQADVDDLLRATAKRSSSPPIRRPRGTRGLRRSPAAVPRAADLGAAADGRRAHPRAHRPDRPALLPAPRARRGGPQRRRGSRGARPVCVLPAAAALPAVGRPAAARGRRGLAGAARVAAAQPRGRRDDRRGAAAAAKGHRRPGRGRGPQPDALQRDPEHAAARQPQGHGARDRDPHAVGVHRLATAPAGLSPEAHHLRHARRDRQARRTFGARRARAVWRCTTRRSRCSPLWACGPRRTRRWTCG